MEERRADLQRAEEKESAEVRSEKVRALFIDLYNYFRMDSGVDPIVLFEQLCCLLIQLSDDGLEFDGAPDPVSSYRTLMARCKRWDRWGISDSAAFADRAKAGRPDAGYSPHSLGAYQKQKTAGPADVRPFGGHFAGQAQRGAGHPIPHRQGDR